MFPVKSRDLFRQAFELRESRGTIISDIEGAIQTALSSIKFHRRELEKYIQDHPRFLYSLQPVSVDKGPKIAELMAEATKKADVGPMAAVAGVLADLAVEDMVSKGAKVAVVENGGEASVVSDRPMDVALVAGDCPLSKRVGFRLERYPMGVATSSGVYSHALSFGDAEAVTIFAGNAGLADAAATAVGNVVKGDDYRGAVERGIKRALSIEGVEGVFILYRDKVGKGGKVPLIIGINPLSRTEDSLRRQPNGSG
jgi:hypothetical protein